MIFKVEINNHNLQYSIKKKKQITNSKEYRIRIK